MNAPATKTRRRRPGRPSNRGKSRASRSDVAIAPAPEEAALESEDGTGPGFPLGRAVEKFGSAHARAIAITILGPAPPEPASKFNYSPLDLEVNLIPPDLTSEPTAVREVILRERFRKVNRAGGVFAYLLRRYKNEVGKFRVLWVGPQTQTLVEETFVVPEPREEREKRDEKFAERAQERERVAHEEAAKKAQGVAAIDEWVRLWVHQFACACGRSRFALGSKSVEVLGAVEAWLRANASRFVRVRHGRWENFPLLFRGARRPVLRRRWVARTDLEHQLDDSEVWAALRPFFPPRERSP